MNAARGFALISAIFLLVVLGTLALYLVSLSGTQHMTLLWAAQGARAHYAAQSGVEWGAAKAAGTGCSNQTLSIDGGGGNTFTVVVQCSSSTFDELGKTYTVWQINATASTGSLGDIGYVQRRASTMLVINPP